MVALVAALGAIIGVSLGALGGGGSVLTVPALVYALGEPAAQATTASLVIVGVTSLAGAVGHARAGRVRWGAGVAFGVAGVLTSFVGTWANRMVDPDLLLLAFAALMLVAAAGMIRRARSGPDVGGAPEPPPADGRSQGGGPAGATTTAAVRARPAQSVAVAVRPTRSWSSLVKMTVAGLVVGFLTGFFGVGGGFVIVPALTLAMGFSMPEAVGTSLLVISINSAAALTARAGNASFDWSVIVPFTITAVIGSMLGKRVADKVSGDTLTRAFAALLVLLAAYVAIRSAAGLAS